MTEKLRGMEDRRNSFSIFRISEGENRMNERKAVFVKLMVNE